jgi:hypothetical protein
MGVEQVNVLAIYDARQPGRSRRRPPTLDIHADVRHASCGESHLGHMSLSGALRMATTFTALEPSTLKKVSRALSFRDAAWEMLGDDFVFTGYPVYETKNKESGVRSQESECGSRRVGNPKPKI